MQLPQFLADSVFSTMGWRDLVDITLIWLMAYQLFLILRGTRAFQSLIGLLALGVLYVIARRLDFYATGFLLDSFFVYIVIAILILFQTDIRRGLARAGGSFFGTFQVDQETSANEELIQAAFSLASRRIGALMVVERGASLDELVDAGHTLESRVSQELLVSIFHPTSPLHDGAAVIQKGRLSAAKVFLPLSLSAEIAKYFGTRHRAALGLSEETDAVIIVVSEERGKVSLVLNGALTPVADTNELRQKLQEILTPGEKPASRPGVAI